MKFLRLIVIKKIHCWKKRFCLKCFLNSIEIVSPQPLMPLLAPHIFNWRTYSKNHLNSPIYSSASTCPSPFLSMSSRVSCIQKELTMSVEGRNEVSTTGEPFTPSGKAGACRPRQDECHFPAGLARWRYGARAWCWRVKASPLKLLTHPGDQCVETVASTFAADDFPSDGRDSTECECD